VINGVFVINEADHLRYGIRHDYYVRLTITLTESISASRSVVYLFEIIIKHKCADNKIAIGSSLANVRAGISVADFTDFTYLIGST